MGSTEIYPFHAVTETPGDARRFCFWGIRLVEPSPRLAAFPTRPPPHQKVLKFDSFHSFDPVRDVAIWEWSNKSEVFGNQIPSADPDSDGVAFELALRFPGQQATDASGLFYNYQREYDPAVGRYSQSDPIGLRGGASIYAYTGNDPLDFVDPLGLLRYHSWVARSTPRRRNS
ncbi:RHS repeat-associated core domain-containing protein [Stenotrophomonas maltophilia]|nr:RHS repeat-associated core domain-containing protein [Stenotrophomonas maltophilia]QGL69554.1 RHS repeat-associated core domain-containing protein [Stenotrophomonas maltophilia]